MPKRLNIVPKEADEQILLAAWLTKMGVRFTASANGGKRNLLEAMKLKRQGVSPGYPDITIPFPSGEFHGLFIELKRTKGGVLSLAQMDWIDYLRKNGYMAEVAHGFDEAKAIVLLYLSLTKRAA